MCVKVCACLRCHTSTVYTGGVPGAAVWDPRGKSWLQGACLPSGRLEAGRQALEMRRGGRVEANEQRRRWAGSCPLTDRIWSMSCRGGSRPSLRTQTYLQCICRAACAVRLSPRRATSVFLLGGELEDGGRIEREEGREGGEREEREGGGGLNVKLPLQRPAKSLSYMENTSRLQGNGTTSEFLQTKIALMSGCDLSVLWPSSLSVSLSHEIPTQRPSSCSNQKQPSTTSFALTLNREKKKSVEIQ